MRKKKNSQKNINNYINSNLQKVQNKQKQKIPKYFTGIRHEKYPDDNIEKFVRGVPKISARIILKKMSCTFTY